MKTGTYDLSDEEYFAEDALNNSYLWQLINKTPAHAQIGIDKTDAMTLGSAVHLAVLQPEISSNLIVQGPENRRGKAWTEAKKDAEINNKILLTGADYIQCMQMRDSVYRNATAATILTQKGTVYEKAAFFEVDGTQCKCKVDAAQGNTIIDLKTSVDASPDGFSHSIAKYGYHQQHALYKYGYAQASGKAVDHFIFVVIEKSPPYACAIYELDAMSEKEGWASAQRAIEIHNECVKENHFHAYSSEKVMLSLPPWSFQHTNRNHISLLK